MFDSYNGDLCFPNEGIQAKLRFNASVVLNNSLLQITIEFCNEIGFCPSWRHIRAGDLTNSRYNKNELSCISGVSDSLPPTRVMPMRKLRRLG